MLERDLLVQLTHGIEAYTDVSQHEVDTGEGLLGISGVGKVQVWSVLLEVDLTGLGYDLLALSVVVIKDHAVYRKTIVLLQKHQGDARGEGGAAASDGYGVAFLSHKNASNLGHRLIGRDAAVAADGVPHKRNGTRRLDARSRAGGRTYRAPWGP